MGQRWIWGSAVLVFFLLPITSAGQQQAKKATVHIVVVDGFGRDLGEARVASFERYGGQDLAKLFRENTAKNIPYGVYQVRCPSPILDRTLFSLSFIMQLGVHNDDAVRQLQESQLPYPLPAVVRAECQAHPCRQISASSSDGSTRSSFLGCSANDVR